MSWSPAAWHDKPARQLPAYPDAAALVAAETELRALPPLIFAGEARALKAQLADVAAGEAFLLQGGDCAESFAEFHANAVRDTVKVLLQMAVVLSYAAGRAGGEDRAHGRAVRQATLARRRRRSTASRCRRIAATSSTTRRSTRRRARQTRRACCAPTTRSAVTLNLLRAFAQGGFADLRRVQQWNQAFVAASPQGARYVELAAADRGVARVHGGVRPAHRAGWRRCAPPKSSPRTTRCCCRMRKPSRGRTA